MKLQSSNPVASFAVKAIAKKAFVPPRIAAQQRIIAEPITDPAEGKWGRFC
jgi:hypothetical protein